MPDERWRPAALAALPHLVQHAQMRQTATYGEIARKIGVHHRAMRVILGYIRDKICRARGLPLISAIVVNGDTKLPGSSFLPEGTADLSRDEYRQRFEDWRDKVYTYPHWDQLLADLALRPVERTPDQLEEEARTYNRVLAARNPGEGDDHRGLKEYIAAHPGELDLASGQGQLEYQFLSGDECDVVFDLGEAGHTVVEIKNGLRGELIRGVYQAIKYRALMRAEKGHGQDYPVLAFLVAYEIPDDIRAFAAKFDVRCQQVVRAAVFPSQ